MQLFPKLLYCIRRIIGESNSWRFALDLKIQLARFLFGVLITVWIETHAYSLNGVHLIWRYSRNSPNRQIYHVYGSIFATV